GNEDPRMVRLWQAELREAANDAWTRTAAKSYSDALKRGDTVHATETARQAVVAHLRDEPQDTLDNFVRSSNKSAHAPQSWDAIDDHASAVVDALKGAVHARPTTPGELGKLHTDLLDSVANGRTPTIDELDEIRPSERPLAVKGRTVIPDG